MMAKKREKETVASKIANVTVSRFLGKTGKTILDNTNTTSTKNSISNYRTQSNRLKFLRKVIEV